MKIDARPMSWLIALACVACPALAQEPPPTAADAKKVEPAKAAPKADEPNPAPKIVAIVGGDIETVTRGTIRRGTILIKDGKIDQVGQGLKVPEGAEVIDAKGKVVTPGFVAVDLSRIGVALASGSSSGKIGDSLDPFDRNLKFALGAGITSGGSQVGGSNNMNFRFNDADGQAVDLSYDDLLELLDCDVLTSRQVLTLVEHAEKHGHAQFGGDEPGLVSISDRRFFSESDSVGSCAACAAAVIDVTGRGEHTKSFEPAPTPAPPDPAPGEVPPVFAPSAPSKPTANKFAVLKLSYGDLDGMLVTETPFHGVPSRNLTGPANVLAWRNAIKEARDYIPALAKHEADVKAGKKDVKPPEKKVDDELIRLVKKEIALRTQAVTIEEIRHQIALAKELDYRLVLDGAHESWLVADELAAANVAVVITPRDRYDAVRGREGRSGTSIETPGILNKAGVHFAVAPLGSSISLDGLPGRDLASLPVEAAFAVRGGIDESTALQALTIEPARILGIADRVGSIEKGKDADLLILDGPPLDYRTYVQTAIVNGKVRYDRDKDRVWPVFERSKMVN